MAKIKTTLFIDKDLVEGLNILSKFTRINKSEYIREGIKMVLEKHKKEVMLMDVGKVPFNEIGPTIVRLREEGRDDEAEVFMKGIKQEIKKVEMLRTKIKRPITKKKKEKI